MTSGGAIKGEKPSHFSHNSRNLKVETSNSKTAGTKTEFDMK